MTLIEAKDAALKESRNQKKTVIYVTVDAEGEADYGTVYKKDSTTLAFLNGEELKEIPIPTIKPTKEVKNKKAVKPAKKVAKRAAKKSAAPKKEARGEYSKGTLYGSKVQGAPKTITVEAALKEIKAGKTVRNAAGYYFSEGSLSKRAKDLKIEVWVKESKRSK
jgi:exoribonuclease R